MSIDERLRLCMYPFKLSWQSWALSNCVILLGYFFVSFFEVSFLSPGTRIFFGLVIFFMIGINLSLTENIVLRIKDCFFIVTLGLFNSLFIIPVIVLAISFFLQGVSELKVIISGMVLIMILLSFQYKYRHEVIF